MRLLFLLRAALLALFSVFALEANGLAAAFILVTMVDKPFGRVVGGAMVVNEDSLILKTKGS